MMNLEFRKNLMYGFAAQMITFLSNVIVSFFLPKYMGIKEFSYWQLFIFYSGYVCFFHLGLPDGLYLIYGGKTIDQLPQEKISGQFRIMVLFQILVALTIIIFDFIFISDIDRKIVILVAAIYLIIINFNNFYGMLYQAVNCAKWYSVSLMIDKAFFCVSLFVFLICDVKSYIPYIITYSIGRAISCLYSWHKRPLFFGGQNSIFRETKEAMRNIRTGYSLMLSVIASSLVLGIGRFFVDRHWGIEAFGIFSFSLTLSNFILQFLNQISIVLFPALRNVDETELSDTYIRLRKWVTILLGLLPLMYLPIDFLVKNWIPQYSASLKYVVFFLPMCFFDGKMQMIATTYMKALRKEKMLLRINIATLVYSTIACAAGAYFWDDIHIVMIGMISAVILRSIFAEIYVTSQLGTCLIENITLEILVVLIYWILVYRDNLPAASVCYLFGYIIFSVQNYKLCRERMRKHSCD